MIRVDPRTGAQKLISSNFNALGLFDLPFGIAVDRDGSLVVVEPRAPPARLPTDCLLPSGSVIRVDPATGTQARITQRSGSLSLPLGLALDPDGWPVVANECGGPSGAGLVRVNPVTGVQTPAASNNDQDFLRTPERVAINPAGDMLVSDYSARRRPRRRHRQGRQAQRRAERRADRRPVQPSAGHRRRGEPPADRGPERLAVDDRGRAARAPRRHRLARPGGAAARLRVGPRRRRHLRGGLGLDRQWPTSAFAVDGRQGRPRARQRPSRRARGRRGHASTSTAGCRASPTCASRRARSRCRRAAPRVTPRAGTRRPPPRATSLRFRLSEAADA